MDIDIFAKILWDYHHVNHTLKKADCILVLGSHDLNVAKYATKLFLDGWAPIIIFSGGTAHQNDLLSTGWNKTEAEMFADVATEMGVPKDEIYIENKATNTKKNFEFTNQLLIEKNINIKTVLIIQKPYMERRTLATGLKYWPDKELIVTSEPITYEEYCQRDIPKENIINIMVGDLQRIKIYGEKGFQIIQEIPDNVWKAYESLVKAGYNKMLI